MRLTASAVPEAFGLLITGLGSPVGPVPRATGDQVANLDFLSFPAGTAGPLHAETGIIGAGNTDAEANANDVDLNLGDNTVLVSGNASSLCNFSGGNLIRRVTISGGFSVIVNGQTVTLPNPPGPNTAIPLDSLGTLTLNEQIPLAGGGLEVNALHFRFTSDPPGIGEVIIASATCGPAGSCPTPSVSPTASPTASPTESPTASPTESPTASPTESPTASPTESPTASPTESPTASPTESPTASPTESPTASPTASPTETPTVSPPAPASPTPSVTCPPTRLPVTGPGTGTPGITPVLLAGAVLLGSGGLLLLVVWRLRRP